MEKSGFQSVDQYIDSFTEDVQETLKKIRETVRKAAPDAQEVISYQMPALKQKYAFVYFAAFKDHYSLFIPPTGVFEAFKEELAPYKIHKATVQFPKNQPIPYDLIAKLTKLSAQKDRELAESKAKK